MRDARLHGLLLLSGLAVMGAPWWVTATVGLVTAAVTIAGVVLGSGRQLKGLREQIQADGEALIATLRGGDRSEWFRRVQWAHGLLQTGATEVVGAQVLHVLVEQADDADARLISALVDSSRTAETTAALDQDPTAVVQRAGCSGGGAAPVQDTEGNTRKGRDDG